MATRKRKDEPLPTIWHVPDDLWERFKPVIDAYDPPAPTGRPRINQRAALDGIIFRMRTGCQWNRLPVEPAAQGVRRRQLRPPHVPDVGETGPARTPVGGDD